MGAPETVTENDDVVVVLVLLFLVEVAAESGVMPEDAKIFVSDAHAGNVLGAIGEGEVQVALSVQGGAGEGVGALAIVVEIRDGHREARLGGPEPENANRSEEHTSELQSPCNLVCRLLLEKKKKIIDTTS